MLRLVPYVANIVGQAEDTILGVLNGGGSLCNSRRLCPDGQRLPADSRTAHGLCNSRRYACTDYRCQCVLHGNGRSAKNVVGDPHPGPGAHCARKPSSADRKEPLCSFLYNPDKIERQAIWLRSFRETASTNLTICRCQACIGCRSTYFCSKCACWRSPIAAGFSRLTLRPQSCKLSDCTQHSSSDSHEMSRLALISRQTAFDAGRTDGWGFSCQILNIYFWARIAFYTTPNLLWDFQAPNYNPLQL
jgi:hypothetical protein